VVSEDPLLQLVVFGRYCYLISRNLVVLEQEVVESKGEGLVAVAFENLLAAAVAAAEDDRRQRKSCRSPLGMVGRS